MRLFTICEIQTGVVHLWKARDMKKVNDYLNIRDLRRNQLFHQMLKALSKITLAVSGGRVLMQSINNYAGARSHSSGSSNPAIQPTRLRNRKMEW